MTPVPQKKSDLSSQEVTRQAKEKLKNALKNNNVDPNTLVKLGNMAFASIKNQALYPMVMQEAARLKLIPQKQKQGFDYKLISQIVAGGKLAEMIMKEGM
jgi:hypothetical protein